MMLRLLLAAGIALGGCTTLKPWQKALFTLFGDEVRRENFMKMDSLAPFRTIQAPVAQFVFPVKFSAISSTYRYHGKICRVDDFLDKSWTLGLTVIRNDTIEYEKFYGKANRDSRFTSFSVAKSFVGTLVGIAIHRGLIASVNDPVVRYVPELIGSAYSDASISDILQMSSGVRFSELYFVPVADIKLWFWDMYFRHKPVNDYLLKVGSNARPGQRFHYKSIDTQALTWLVTKVFNKPLHQIMQEEIWMPLGMESGASWNTDETGNEIGFGFLNATQRDFAKLGRLYLHQGMWNGQLILPKQWVDDATHAHSKKTMPGNVALFPLGYGYQWWIADNSAHEYTALGVWGQYIYVNTRENVIIVKNSADENFSAHTAETIEMFRAIASAASPG